MTDEEDFSRVELETWHFYDAGGPVLLLKLRFRDRVELPSWQDGLDLFTTLGLAEAEGWQAYDREPGAAPDEYAIVHMKRTRPLGEPDR